MAAEMKTPDASEFALQVEQELALEQQLLSEIMLADPKAQGKLKHKLRECRANLDALEVLHQEALEREDEAEAQKAVAEAERRKKARKTELARWQTSKKKASEKIDEYIEGISEELERMLKGAVRNEEAGGLTQERIIGKLHTALATNFPVLRMARPAIATMNDYSFAKLIGEFDAKDK